MRRQREGLLRGLDCSTSAGTNAGTSAGTSAAVGMTAPDDLNCQNQLQQQQRRHCYHRVDTRWTKIKTDYARAKENNNEWREAEKERVRRARMHEHTTRQRQHAKFVDAGRRRPVGSKRGATPAPSFERFR
jgi:hypothetical protein